MNAILFNLVRDIFCWLHFHSENKKIVKNKTNMMIIVINKDLVKDSVQICKEQSSSLDYLSVLVDDPNRIKES